MPLKIIRRFMKALTADMPTLDVTVLAALVGVDDPVMLRDLLTVFERSATTIAAELLAAGARVTSCKCSIWHTNSNLPPALRGQWRWANVVPHWSWQHNTVNAPPWHRC